MNPDKLLKPKEAATMLNVSPSTIYRMGMEGQLSRNEISKRCVRYRYSEIVNLINGIK